MSAGAGYNPSSDSTTRAIDFVCVLIAGVPTQLVRQEATDGAGVLTVTYRDPATDAIVILSPIDEATARPGACDAPSLSATMLLGGPTAPAGSSPDGSTFDFNAYLGTIAALLGGQAVLQGYEFVVLDGDSIATAGSVNRVEFVEPGNNNGSGAVRSLSKGMSVKADATDSDVLGLRVTPAMTLNLLGSSRVLLKVTAKRAQP